MKKEAQVIKELVIRKAESSRLILWGYGERVKKFYMENRERYRICGCVTEQRHHPEYLDDEKTMPIIKWEDYKSGPEDYVILFGSPYVHIENQISASGLRIFEEFVDANILEALTTNKKLAIIAGSCQVAILYDFLNVVPSFTDEYLCFRLLTHWWKSRYSLKSLSYLKNLCDLYICMKHEEDDIKFFSSDELPGDCKIITIPYALSRIYWPQLKTGWKDNLNEYFIKDKSIPGHGPFEYGDRNINRMLQEGKSLEEIEYNLNSDDFYSEEKVHMHVDMALRALELVEDGCDVKVSQFVRDHYLEKMLYWDFAHPENSVIWQVVLQILDILGIDPGEQVRNNILNNEIPVPTYYDHCTEIPVYPSVAKRLGLKWWKEDMKYNVTFYNGVKKLTFNEYIRAYYSVCSHFKAIKENW